jgi:putative polyketide hydroxylase
MNTGLADVHNLMWKIALVYRGLAPASLLATYDTERRPVATANTATSIVNCKRTAVAAAKVVSKHD